MFLFSRVWFSPFSVRYLIFEDNYDPLMDSFHRLTLYMFETKEGSHF